MIIARIAKWLRHRLLKPTCAGSNPAAGANPVAWRVKNDFGHWYMTADKRIADTYRDIEKLDVQPLYLGVAQRHPFADR